MDNAAHLKSPVLDDLRVQGFSILRGALPDSVREKMTALQAVIDELVARSGDTANPLHRTLYDRYTLTSVDVDQAMALEGFYRDLSEASTRPILNNVLGPVEIERSMYGGVFVSDRRLANAAKFYWHPDGHYDGLYPASLNFWIPLRACGTDAPSLKLLRATPTQAEAALPHLPVAIGPPKKRAKPLSTGVAWKLTTDEHMRDLFGASAMETPLFELGDVLLFTNWTLHRTFAPDWMPLARGAMIVRFWLPGTRAL